MSFSHPNIEKNNEHRIKVIRCSGIIRSKKILWFAGSAGDVVQPCHSFYLSILSCTAYLASGGSLVNISSLYITIWICLYVFVVLLFWGLAAVDVRVQFLHCFLLPYSIRSFKRSCAGMCMRVETCRYFTMTECGALIITYAQVSLFLSRCVCVYVSLYPMLFSFTQIASSLGKLLFE